MISVEKITVDFGGFTLLNELSYVINRRDRVALVGKNGAGKSTMLKILAGLQEATSGRVSYPKELTIGYLPQHMVHSDVRTVREEAELAFNEVKRLQEAIDTMNSELAERTDYESDAYNQLIERVTLASEHLLMMGATNFGADVEKTLLGLGFLRDDFERLTSEFSGGWRMRIELAKILLRKPDLLLLDEPTNHLDIESIQWLEQFLASGQNAVVLVSHDRAFLDNVTNRTIEITLGRIYDYRVPYTQFLELRKERREQQQRAYENQREQIEKTEDFIERFRYKATKAVQVQSRIKQLEKIDRLEVDDEDTSRLRLRFPAAPRSGDYPVVVNNVTKCYGSYKVFGNVNLTLRRGEKVAFVGKNGEGKSTLVKCIMSEIDFDGELKLGHNVMIGYFAQNQASLLDESKTVFETIDYAAVGDIRSKIRDLLGGFMFGGEASEKSVSVLSGGERTRLAMIKLLLEPVNLLILDEPTNHLDIRSKEVLKEALRNFDGTVILVSHDRDFLAGLATKVYEFGNKQVYEHMGDIYDFLQRKKLDNLRELERNHNQNELQTDEATTPTTNKLNYEARKEQNKQLNKLKRQTEESEKSIARLEAELSELETQLASGDPAVSPAMFVKHAALKKSLDDEMEHWTQLQEELDALNG